MKQLRGVSRWKDDVLNANFQKTRTLMLTARKINMELPTQDFIS